MKKLRFFGLLVTVVLLAFGLSVGCNNDTTTTGGESDPVVYRGTSNGRAIEITFDTAPIPGRARATEPRPGDNYLITIDGQTASSGWIELQEGGLIKFHDTTGKGDFDGQLIGQTVIVQVPGEPASLTAGLVGGSGTYNPGGGGPGGNVGSGPGTPGTTAPGAVAVPGEFLLTTPAAAYVAATAYIFTSDNYIILDENGEGSLQIGIKILPEDATNKAISVWTLTTDSITTGTAFIDGTSGNGSTGTNGLLTVKGGNSGDHTNTVTITPTIINGATTSTPYQPALTITVYRNGTVAPPKITLVGGANESTYIAGKSSVKIDAESRTEIRYLNSATTITAGTPTPVTGLVYNAPLPVISSQTGNVFIRAIAVNTDGVASPDVEVQFTQAQTPVPVITLNDGDFAAGGLLAGYVLAQGGAKASTFTITSPVSGAEIYYTTADGGATVTAPTSPLTGKRYTGPVTVTDSILSSVPNLQISAIVYMDGYSPAAATTITAITQAKVQDPVITISSGGVPQTESATGTNATDTFHLNTTNPSLMMITTPTKGASIFYTANVDAAPTANTKQAIDDTWTNAVATNLRHPWTTPVGVIGGTNGIPRFEGGAAVSATSTNVQVKAYATKPGYLPSTSDGTNAGTVPAVTILALAQVQEPTWIRDPNTGKKTTDTGGAAISVTSRADWTDYRYLEIFCPTPGAIVPYTITPQGVTAITVTPTTAPAGNITYVDLTATNVMTAIDALTQGQTLTLALPATASTKTGYKDSGTTGQGSVTALVFTKNYSDN